MSERWTRGLRVGTRGSELALAQAKAVREALRERGCESASDVLIRTSGDLKQELSGAKVADKKEWVAELERALVLGEIDLAVHSAKDVPLLIEPGTKILSVLKRERACDVFVARSRDNAEPLMLSALPKGSAIGTSSRRRGAQILATCKGAEVVELRGNVTTRLRKLAESSTLAGIVIAFASLKRLGLSDEPKGAGTCLGIEPLDLDNFVPASGQGILVVQYRQEDAELGAVLSGLSALDTQCCWLAERACVGTLGADCQSAVGVHARFLAGILRIKGMVLSESGEQVIEGVAEAAVDVTSEQNLRGRHDAEARSISLGERLGNLLLEQGAAKLLGCV